MTAKIVDSYGGRHKGLPQTLTLDHVSPATRLLEKRRQMFEVQEALDAQKEEFSRREDAFRRREEALRKKDLELQESLIKFNKFLQENESKRNRAIKRASDERKQREQKEAEIGRLHAQLEQKMEDEKALKKQVAQNMKYQLYLADVVDFVTEDFHEIQELLNRYKTLMDANHDLADRQRENEGESENKRVHFANYTKERANEILNANNEIASLQKKLESGEALAYRLQNEVDFSIRGNSDKTLELGQILSCVENLLERFEMHMRSHKQNRDSEKKPAQKQRSAEELEREGQRAMDHLDEIATYMTDYKDIVDDYIAAGKAPTLGAPLLAALGAGRTMR
jgi:chromosome segregation ATPase